MSTNINLASIAPFPTFTGILNQQAFTISVGMPTFAGTIIFDFLKFAIEIPMPTFSGALHPESYELVAVAPMPAFYTEFATGTLFQLAATVPIPVAAFGIIQTYTVAGSAPFPTFSGLMESARVSFTLGATALFPSFSAYMQVSKASVTATALVLNLFSAAQADPRAKVPGVTFYPGYAFNSFGELEDGRYLGASSTGIYILDGDDDQGTEIKARIELGDKNFGVTQAKNIPEIIFDCESEAAMDVSAVVDGGDECIPYRTISSANKINTNRRAELPLGLLGCFYKIILENVNGGDFELRSIDIPVDISSRKVVS